jgi:hypothetical protein
MPGNIPLIQVKHKTVFVSLSRQNKWDKLGINAFEGSDLKAMLFSRVLVLIGLLLWVLLSLLFALFTC